MRVYGLLDLKNLFLSKNINANLENAMIAAYKMSEDGASGIVIYGNINDEMKVYDILRSRMDIPVFVFINNSKYFIKNISSKENYIFSERLENAKHLKVVKGINDLKELGKTILITNDRILKIFREEKDFLPEIIASVAYYLFNNNCKIFVTEEVLSAIKGIKVAAKFQSSAKSIQGLS